MGQLKSNKASVTDTRIAADQRSAREISRKTLIKSLSDFIFGFFTERGIIRRE